jgi:hypothetical protein
MFKKIEIWVLYLVLVFVFISYIIFGAILRRELKGGGPYIPVITPLSKVVVFLSEIPHNLKYMKSHDVRTPNQTRENRFGSLSGFIGDANEKEKYLLLSRYDGDLKEGVVELVDLKSFDVLHTWNPDINSFFEKVDKVEGGVWEHLMRDNNNDRFRIFHPILFEDGSLLFQGNNTPLIKIDKNSELEWMKDDEFYHHSNEEDIDGNVWVCVRYYPYKIDEKYVGDELNTYSDDGIRRISSNGEILFDKSVSEIFIENDMEYLLFSTTGFKKDPIHLNDIQPVEKDTKYWKKGDVFLSFRHQSMVMLYRPKTNEIIWKGIGKFYHQHDVDILDDSRISIFNNNSKNTFSGDIVDGNNRVVIYDFETEKYSYHLEKSLKKEDVRTITEGRSQILPNGDLFIEETNYGRLLYFNSDGSLRWTHVNRSKKGNVYLVQWSRILYENEDIEKVNRFLKIKNEITYNE